MFAQKWKTKTTAGKQVKIQFNNIFLFAKEYEYMSLYSIDKQTYKYTKKMKGFPKSSKNFENGSTSRKTTHTAPSIVEQKAVLV